MTSLIIQVKNLQKSEIRNKVEDRLNEFTKINKKDFNELFRELAFCILTAGTSAELGIKTIDHLGETLHKGNRENIQEKLKQVYRFHTVRAGYIHEARSAFAEIDINHPEIRRHLVGKIKGIGMKEASHFLRNIGFFDYAIVDFHIVDLLVNNNLIEKPKTLTLKKYLEIENVLRILAYELGMTLGELDLYLWYLETGKILK